MQYKVPQNVDMPDRVIAGMTLRQFMFLMFAGGFILVFNYILVGPIRFLFIPAVILLAGAGISLAFVKINDRPLEVFLLSAAKTFFSPSTRVWSKDTEEEIIKPVVMPKLNSSQSLDEKLRKKSELQKLASIIDSGLGLVDPDRITNIKNRTAVEPEGLHDVIAETEKPSLEIEKIIKESDKKVIKNKELPVSSMASIKSNPEDFIYENIEVKNSDKTKAVIDRAKQNDNFIS